MWGCRSGGRWPDGDTRHTGFRLWCKVLGHAGRKGDGFPLFLLVFSNLSRVLGDFAGFCEVGLDVFCAEFRLRAGGADAVLDKSFIEGKPCAETSVWFQQMDLEGSGKQCLVLGKDKVSDGVESGDVALGLDRRCGSGWE